MMINNNLRICLNTQRIRVHRPAYIFVHVRNLQIDPHTSPIPPPFIYPKIKRGSQHNEHAERTRSAVLELVEKEKLRLDSSILSSSLETQKKLSDVLNSFDAPIRYAFAYGSGVFKQRGYDGAKEPMIDFVFGVRHPQHWHSLNMRQNRSHYSGVAVLGSQWVGKIQEFGAGIYYNPYVHVNGMKIKYGIISIDTLTDDLQNWSKLYVSGRMQKPILVLRDDIRIRTAQHTNLSHAVRAALCLLPSEFTEEELFHKIAGDFRMKFGENPHKVYNIVYTQMDAFRKLYTPIIEQLPNISYIRDGTLHQDEDPKMKLAMIQSLPSGLLAKIKVNYRWHLTNSQKYESGLGEEPKFSLSLASSFDLSKVTSKALEDTVKWTAISQSLKGIITAGPLRSLTYIAEKLSKRKTEPKS
ncbi:Mitochondrial translocator assembly and maintenance protein 41 [Nowakowskiella sp. JEL0078]|nr:Mitochondrial translocator assembly and maintenance protein 41 [Nowakowskiella sp. JEL0078]